MTITAKRMLPRVLLGAAEDFDAPFDFAAVYRSSSLDRIEAIKLGVSTRYLLELTKALDMTQESVFGMLGLPRTTMNRKIRDKQPLATDQSERVIGLARLVGQVEAMVQESGDPAGFDAARWVSAWLHQPNPALGERRPIELMDTVTGQELVSGLLARMQSGAYA